MPEVILPCPECGDDECLIVLKQYPSEEWSVHCGCGHAGRYCATEEDAIKAHNALPRALTWTHEPPKVAGKYWWRPSGKKIGRIRDMFVRNGEVGFLDRNDRFVKDTGDGEWAGPIAPPIE